MSVSIMHKDWTVSAESAGDLPSGLRVAFEPAGSLAAAQRWARHLTCSTYENFPVISLMLPRAVRQDFCNIYAFCRQADDLGDELSAPEQSLDWLGRLRQMIRQICAGGEEGDGEPGGENLRMVLADTILRHQIPAQPFLDLIDAFEQDQRVRRYETFEQLLDYCRRSANPVGRLVLYVCGYTDQERHALADFTCTGLQLANFWQDVRRDLITLDRIYIPLESMQRFGVTEAQLRQSRCDDRFRELMRFEVKRAEEFFDRGAKLLPKLRPQVRRHVALFGQAGHAVLQAIRNQNYDTLSSRPVITRVQKTKLIAWALLICIRGRLLNSEAIWQH